MSAGRPLRTEEPTRVITLRVSENERARLRQAAAANFQDLSNFVRDVALDAAAETLDENDEEGTESEVT